MKLRRTGGGSGLPEKIEIPMTPMIDMVFQLLVFFIMNFRVVDQEGDFNVKMPLAGNPAAPSTTLDDQFTLALAADENGDLAGITLNGEAYASLKDVRDRIIGDVAPTPSADESGAEVELDCAPNLKYGHTVDAISAVSGWVNERGDVVRLVSKIRFSPPKE
jgi:biopolymer transport protein ExbD